MEMRKKDALCVMIVVAVLSALLVGMAWVSSGTRGSSVSIVQIVEMLLIWGALIFRAGHAVLAEGREKSMSVFYSIAYFLAILAAAHYPAWNIALYGMCILGLTEGVPAAIYLWKEFHKTEPPKHVGPYEL